MLIKEENIHHNNKINYIELSLYKYTKKVSINSLPLTMDKEKNMLLKKVFADL
jgi:hypothetical protein